MRAAIILTAGRSKRFGTANKLLAPYRGKPLLRSVIDAALRAPVGRVIVVTGADSSRVARVVHGAKRDRLSVVYAKKHHLGQRESLLAGLKSLRADENEAFIFLGDMPQQDAVSTIRLLRAHSAEAVAVRPTYRAVPGHPVLIRNMRYVIDRLSRGLSPLEGGVTLNVPMPRSVVIDVDRGKDLIAMARK